MQNKIDLPVLRVSCNDLEPDNKEWRYRFKIKSETSNRKYTIAQNKKKLFWGCSCMGWKANRNCKHLKKLGLPNYEKPYDVQFKVE